MTAVSPVHLTSAGSLGGGRYNNWGHTGPRIARAEPQRPMRSTILTEGAVSNSYMPSAAASASRRVSISDSSDEDDIPPPMAFSAQTRAILENENAQKDPEQPKVEHHEQQDRQRSTRPSLSRSLSKGSTPSRGTLRISRKSPPPPTDAENRSPPRVVHLTESRSGSSLRRSASHGEGILASSRRQSRESPVRELITPAPAPRIRTVLRSRPGSPTSGSEHQSSSRSSGKGSSGSARHAASSSGPEASAERRYMAQEHDSAVRDRNRPGQDAMTSSMRLRRVPVGSGTFLKGAPMRRGFRRRQSEEEQSAGEDYDGPQMPENEAEGEADDVHVTRRSSPRADGSKVKAEVAVQDFARASNTHRNHRVDSESRPRSDHRASNSIEKAVSSTQSRQASSSSVEKQQPVFRAPPVLPSHQDQENEPPPTFKRNKPMASSILGSTREQDVLAIESHNKPEKISLETHGGRSPVRQPLASMSGNTPRRAPPPPPKMSVLDTATASAGASTIKSKKKRTHVVVNGKTFTLRGRLGKGGSSDVYRVMAENDKIFALKKVNLEDCNEDTVRGYKGEIDLLKKLENVDRVVRLYDWEVNEQKQSLSVLMEMGESDLNRILSHRLQPEDAKLDLSFTRHYWREMVSCVGAVHDYDIVHSDLKPANFLLVQGQLKLIDFGIANAIDVENTVNVHRETNVGTPNYMSPESLQDTNANERGAGVAKLMKLGKPSDIWSLGCILYQMTYGRPPFAHIPNQWNRVMAIINPNVAITYPNQGIGGVCVPSSLRRLLKRCLNRDFTQRPTIAQLLDDREAFLNPDAEGDSAVPMTEELLGQILQNVINRCRDPKRGIPTDTDLKGYPKAFLERIRNSLEKV